MVRKRRSQGGAHCVIRLAPDETAERSLARTEAAYAALAAWLDSRIPLDHPADLVALHRGWYETARAEVPLPAQAITLALRDWAARRRGEAVPGIPYDDKLYAMRGVDAVSLATIDGRVTVPCAVAGYGDGRLGVAPARLHHDAAGWELRVDVDERSLATDLRTKAMASEGVLTRIGRVITGMTHAAVGAAEQANPEAVLEQAIREIEGAADEVRTELGRATAERHRLELRSKELERERAELDGKIRIAVKERRDDLAEAGIARQLDIEAQSNVLLRLLADSADQIQQLNATLDAVRASRREAEERLKQLRSQRRAAPEGAGAAPGGAAGERAFAAVERAQAVAERLTGVPSGPPRTDQKALDELDALQRERAVKERLAQLKAGAA
jgi:phage shock protein A